MSFTSLCLPDKCFVPPGKNIIGSHSNPVYVHLKAVMLCQGGMVASLYVCTQEHFRLDTFLVVGVVLGTCCTVFCSIRTFLGEKTLNLLNSVYPEIKRELEKFTQQDALRAPLNDLRIFGELILREAAGQEMECFKGTISLSPSSMSSPVCIHSKAGVSRGLSC